MYEIESKSDLAGVMLVIRFPEEELDKKAMYTIQADQPNFLVPFHCLCVDGQVECTYRPGNRGRLLHRCSSRTPEELAGFWERVLQPLLDCDDWFLDPFSFVMDTRYLYTDKEEKAVSYLYVPSKREWGGLESLREMAAELSRKNPSTDAELEVKVLRGLMQDFQPRAFLKMLRENCPAAPVEAPAEGPAFIPAAEEAAPEKRPGKPEEAAEKTPKRAEEAPAMGGDICEDIQINLSGGSRPGRKNRGEKKGLFGHKADKKEKPEGKSGGLFGRKKETKPSKAIMLGAAAEEPVKREPIHPPAPDIWSGSDGAMEDDGVTEVLAGAGDGPCFHLAGDAGLPREIPVNIAPGGVFTIGRYDVTVGRRQSDFEFPAKTKAVSRRHAVIERDADGSYALVDMDSAAGTFVDGERVRPNLPRRLRAGARVSFGTAGADYVWEE